MEIRTSQTSLPGLPLFLTTAVKFFEEMTKVRYMAIPDLKFLLNLDGFSTCPDMHLGGEESRHSLKNTRKPKITQEDTYLR